MSRYLIPVLTCVVILAGVAAAQQTPAPAPAPVAPAETKLRDPLKDTVVSAETTLQDQTDVAVTIYNNDLALVRDRRKVKLLPGEQALKFMDVAEKIRPETVSLKSLSAPGSLAILEQNYAYDLMSPAKLMEKYVGKQVRLVNLSTEVSFSQVDAQLLSVNEGPVYQVGRDIYLGHPGQVVLPEVPENLIAKPTLVWLLQNGGTDHDVEVTYLTGGIGWKADYVVTLDKAETKIDLEAWVTLNNQSGAQYTSAQMKVVAGEVNVVPRGRPETLNLDYAAGAAMKAMPAPMREETFAEYHLYTLPRRTTIKQNESKQVSLLTAVSVGVTKVYEYRGNEGFYSQPIPPQKEEKVGVFLKFMNKQENHLGMPLPAGVMRVYQEDSEKMLQFAGEDAIKHTPKDEEVRLHLGNAFDVIGERTQTDFQRISDRVFESTFEIKLRNHKDNNITVDVVEPMTEDWTILEKSHEFVKKDARTAVFSLPVAANGETVLTYRVRVTY